MPGWQSKKEIILKIILGILLAAYVVIMTAMAVQAASVTFAWNGVTANDLAGYRLYQSNTSGIYNKTTGKVCDVTKSVTSCSISNLADGTYYWVATAYDTSGNESTYSNEVMQTVDTTAPGAPNGLKVTITVTVSQ